MFYVLQHDENGYRVVCSCNSEFDASFIALLFKCKWIGAEGVEVVDGYAYRSK